MKPTIPALTQEFTRLVGPEAFAKAEAAIAAAKVAAEAAAKAAAEKAAAAAAAAKAAAEKAAAEKAALPANVGGMPSPRIPSSVVPPSGGISAPAANTTPLPLKGGPTNTTANPRREVTPPTSNPAPRVAAPAAPRPATTAPAAPPRSVAPPPAPAVPMPTLPVQATAHAAKGYDFDALVAPSQVVEAAQILDRQGFALDTITGVDWIAQGEMEVVYDYFHPTESLRIVIRTRVPRATPDVPTITAVFPGANWHERETHDFFGIRFAGHPNLKPFLLPEDADFHPLRKDYQP